jgi:hypothetical protein
MNQNPPDGPIRITKEEANSSHVDDLLKRQMSLRGEGGVTRDRGRKWFYQTWFVLSVVGLLGALVAWACLEPYFHDLLYLQGKITAINPDDNMPRLTETESELAKYRRAVAGSITINEERIFLLGGTRELRNSGSSRQLDFDALEVGDKIGVHLEYEQRLDEDIALGFYVTRDLKPETEGQARLSLDDMARQAQTVNLVFFAVVAGFIGLFIGAADGIICRQPRRAILCAFVGLLVGVVGGFICSIAAGVAYAPLTHLAQRQSEQSASGLSTLGFVIQIFGRSLAWCLAGVAMGLGQGIALRSKRLLIYGLLGGVVGGLLGGLLFDPIDQLVLGGDRIGGQWSRLVALLVIGLSVGGMIGLVELMARDAWLRMTQGPLTGKEFLLFKDVMNIGSSPRSDIYLFNDSLVVPDHAVIRAIGDECELEARHSPHPVQVNHISVQRARLRHGDTVTIGRTSFVFQRRKG